MPKRRSGESSARLPGAAAKPNTRDMLLDAAERLFAEHGFDGISLRRIGTETAQGNTAAIHYHFGDKENLIKEVMARRARRFEQLREEQLQKVLAQGRPWDLTELLKVSFVPLGDLYDPSNRSLSARFNLHYLMSEYHVAVDQAEAGPARTQFFEMLLERLPFLSSEELGKRIVYLTGMFCLALLEQGRQKARGETNMRDTDFFEDLYQTMTKMIQVEANAKMVASP